MKTIPVRDVRQRWPVKLVITDPYSDHVERVISEESGVVVTTLGELEARVQLRGWLWVGRY